MKAKFAVLVVALLALVAAPAMGAVVCPPSSPWPPVAGPIVKAVPWVPPQAPTCLIVPHDTVSGANIYLKATVDSTATQYYWDYGDGSAAMTWTPVNTASSNAYQLNAQHTYTGSAGTSFTATVYVKDGATPANINSAKYYITIRTASLQVQVNMAIDQALWRLHREMNRIYGPASGAGIYSYWNTGNYASSGYVGNNAVNTTAFLVNGHKPDYDPANPDPYAETALRGLNGTLYGLAQTGALPNVTNARGTFKPDGNNNSNGVYVPENDMYEGGMVMDMLAATGMPDYVAAVGNPGIISQKLKDILQDMMDWYTYCQGVGVGPYSGGWRYGCRYGSSDGSICQWAAVGMLAATNPSAGFGLSYPPPLAGTPPVPVAGTSPVILANQDWIIYDFDGHGFGYTDPGYYPWSPWAVTPSGMVQMVMDGITRGTPGSPTMWDHTEDWIRANFDGPLGYYYGLFSFTKSMLLSPGGGFSQLCARDAFPSNNMTNCIDWYAAQTPADPIDGVAKTLVSSQNPDGFWWCHEQTGAQCYFETAWATIMLNRTVFQSGLPVAVIDASPSTVVNGGTVNLTGKNSFHQDPTKHIALWDWDLSGTGSGPFSASGVNQNGVVIHTTSTSYPVSFPVRLRVTDNTTPVPLTAIATLTITITNPPYPPTANAGGPYNICPQTAYLPFYLNGTGSAAAPGHATGTSYPDNKITNYEWDLLGTGTYPMSGPTLSQPRVDDYYSSQGLLGSGSTILVGLRVTDNSMLSFGIANNLQGTATTQIHLSMAADEVCSKCVLTGQAIPHGAVPGKAGYIQLVWLETGADHYNIYRGIINGGPYTLIGTVVNTLVGTGKSLGYTDNGPLTAGVTYYYRIAPATLADVETCQSNQASASGTLPKGR